MSETAGPGQHFGFNPFAAIAIIAFSTLMAVAYIPDDYGADGALRLSGLIMGFGFAAIPAFAGLLNIRSLAHGGHILMLAPGYWLLGDLVRGASSYANVERSDIYSSFVAIGVFALGIAIAFLFQPGKLPQSLHKAARVDISGNRLFLAGIGCFIAAFSRFAVPCNFDIPLMIQALTYDRWGTPWAREAIGGWDAFLDHLEYFGYVLPCLTVMIAKKGSWFSGRALLMVLLTLIILVFVAQGGGRRVVGAIILSAIAYEVLSRPSLHITRLWAVAGALVALLILLEVILQVRSRGVEHLLGESDQAVEVELNDIHVDDNFLRLAQVMQIFPERHDYVYMKYVIYIAVRPVPRVFWPSKPKDPGFDLARYLGDEGVSYSYTVVGELFSAGGFMGVLLGGLFYGWLANKLTLLLRYRSDMSFALYSAGLLALFAGFRSAIDLVLMSYVLLVWLGVSWVLAPRERPHSHDVAPTTSG